SWAPRWRPDFLARRAGRSPGLWRLERHEEGVRQVHMAPAKRCLKPLRDRPARTRYLFRRNTERLGRLRYARQALVFESESNAKCGGKRLNCGERIGEREEVSDIRTGFERALRHACVASPTQIGHAQPNGMVIVQGIGPRGLSTSRRAMEQIRLRGRRMGACGAPGEAT